MDDRHKDTQRFIETLGTVCELLMIAAAVAAVGCLVWLLS